MTEILHGLAAPMLHLVLQRQSELLPNSPGFSSSCPLLACRCQQHGERDRRAKIETLTQIRDQPAFEAG